MWGDFWIAGYLGGAGVAGQHRFARWRTIAWRLVRRGERWLNARSAREAGAWSSSAVVRHCFARWRTVASGSSGSGVAGLVSMGKTRCIV